jgi:hypothetical protein
MARKTMSRTWNPEANGNQPWIEPRVSRPDRCLCRKYYGLAANSALPGLQFSIPSQLESGTPVTPYFRYHLRWVGDEGLKALENASTS